MYIYNNKRINWIWLKLKVKAPSFGQMKTKGLYRVILALDSTLKSYGPKKRWTIQPRKWRNLRKLLTYSPHPLRHTSILNTGTMQVTGADIFQFLVFFFFFLVLILKFSGMKDFLTKTITNGSKTTRIFVIYFYSTWIPILL